MISKQGTYQGRLGDWCTSLGTQILVPTLLKKITSKKLCDLWPLFQVFAKKLGKGEHSVFMVFIHKYVDLYNERFLVSSLRMCI